MTEKRGTAGLKQQIEDVVRAAECGDFSQLNVIAAGLQSDDPDIRIKAASIAERIGSPQLLDPLAYMALHDEESPNRNQAIYALAGIGTPAVVPVLAEALKDTDPDRREDARTALYHLLGEDVLALFSDDDEQDNNAGSTEASEVLQWWSDQSAEFDDRMIYAFGEPGSPARIVEEIERQGPGLPDAYLKILKDWTGQDLGREPLSKTIANWRSWLAEHGAAYESGRRYFHGHRLPDP